MTAQFVLSFDFEDWHQIVRRRLGDEDWRDGDTAFARHVALTLDLLDELGVTATFFVAGVTAERHPGALREVAARGHEIGCHGHDHRHLYRFTPDEFREDVRRCLEVIATICEVEPLGYRAPWFSINRTTSWAFGILRELGFRYDSSLFDSPRLRNRIRPVPTHPFRVEDELWEFPIAVARRGRLVLPLGGGTYWRLLPAAGLRRGLDSVAEQSTLPVLYFHPYELAPETLEVVLPAGAGRLARLQETRRRVHKNVRRHLIEARIREMASRFRLVPFCDVLPPTQDDRDPTLLRPARASV